MPLLQVIGPEKTQCPQAVYFPNQSKTAADISAAQSAYATLLADPMTKLGLTTGLVTGAFSDAYDKLLDNLSIKVTPAGETVISTSAGTQSNDLSEAATTNSAFTYVKVAAGALPSQQCFEHCGACSRSIVERERLGAISQEVTNLL